MIDQTNSFFFMRFLLTAGLVSALFHDCSAGEELRQISDAEGVVAIYRTDVAVGSSKPKLICAVWPDGLMVWSVDQLCGGPPYKKAILNAKETEMLFMHLYEDLFNNGVGNDYINHDGHSNILTLSMNYKDRKLVWESCHEPIEAGGSGVVTEGAVFSLKDESRMNILRKESVNYLMFRLAWLECRNRLMLKILRDGEDCRCDIRQSAGVATLHISN